VTCLSTLSFLALAVVCGVAAWLYLIAIERYAGPPDPEDEEET